MSSRPTDRQPSPRPGCPGLLQEFQVFTRRTRVTSRWLAHICAGHTRFTGWFPYSVCVVDDRRSEENSSQVSRSPSALWVAAVLLGLEGIGAAGYGVLTITKMTHVTAGVGYGVAGMMIGWGVGLGLVARGVALARRWARGPAVVLQLIDLPLAWGFRTSFGWLALVLFLSSAVVLICLFLPASTKAFTGGREVPFSGRRS